MGVLKRWKKPSSHPSPATLSSTCLKKGVRGEGWCSLLSGQAGKQILDQCDPKLMRQAAVAGRSYSAVLWGKQIPHGLAWVPAWGVISTCSSQRSSHVDSHPQPFPSYASVSPCVFPTLPFPVIEGGKDGGEKQKASLSGLFCTGDAYALGAPSSRAQAELSMGSGPRKSSPQSVRIPVSGNYDRGRSVLPSLAHLWFCAPWGQRAPSPGNLTLLSSWKSLHLVFRGEIGV